MNRGQFRMLMLLTVVSGLVGGALSGLLVRPNVVAAQGGKAPRAIDAQEFRLVDAAGKQRAMLMLTADGSPALGLSDAAGKLRAGFLPGADGNPNLFLQDSAGKGGPALSMNAHGSFLTLRDSADKVRASLVVTPDGPALTITDAGGRDRARVGACGTKDTATGTVTQYPESRIQLMDAEGKVLWNAP